MQERNCASTAHSTASTSPSRASWSALGEGGALPRKYVHRYQSFAQELQAQINEEVADILLSNEGDDLYRFGKVRQTWEKEIRDPDDVFIEARGAPQGTGATGQSASPAQARHQGGTSIKKDKPPAPQALTSNLASTDELIGTAPRDLRLESQGFTHRIFLQQGAGSHVY